MKKLLSIVIVLMMVFNYAPAFADAVELFTDTGSAVNILEESTERKVVIASEKAISDLTLYVAAFKDDAMIGAVSKMVDLVIGNNPIEVEPTWAVEERDFVEIFLWDENLTPYAKKVVTKTPTVSVETVYADVEDKTVKVEVSILNNPGISSLKFDVDYDADLKLTDVELSEAFGAYLTAAEPFTNPQPISLITPFEDINVSGVLATLTFDMSDVPAGKNYADVNIICDAENIFDANFEFVDFSVANGKIIFDETLTLTECMEDDESSLMAGENLTLTVEEVSGMPGDTVEVDLTLSNNPGIASLMFNVEYDEVLTLESVSFNSDFGSYATAAQPFTNPQPVSFISPFSNVGVNGTFATLRFKIADTAEDKHVADISITYSEDDIFDSNYNYVDMTAVNGSVTVYEGLPGDINADGKVNNMDAIMHFRYVAKWPVAVDEEALDVTGDGKINNVDAIQLFRYVAGWPDVVLVRGKVCEHEVEAIAAKVATCIENGNIAYWHCIKCDTYYSDATATNVVSLANTVLEATGHTVVIDAAVAPTYDSTGLTEGKHCSVCDAVIVAQTVVPKLDKDEYTITYHIYNNDNYLKSIDIDNPNPLVYSSQDGLALQDLIVEGYNFKGWYTAQTGGVKVTTIEKGETGNKAFYAQWEKVTYTVSFACDMVSVDDIEYQVGDEKSLPKPSLDKYIFVGWTDKDGRLWSSIPAGTTGDMNLYANWSSNRNKAVPVDKLTNPMIFEDDEKGLILFAYELGEIQNVPLFTTLKLNCVNGIISTHSQTETEEISSTQASTIAKVISNATTNTAAWTLSSDWNETTQVSETYLEETGQTREEAETISKSESNNYFLNTSSSSTESTVEVDGSSYKKLYGNDGNLSNTSSSEYSTGWGLGAGGEWGVGGESGKESGDKKSKSLVSGLFNIKGILNANTGESVKNNDSGTTQNGWHDNKEDEEYESTTKTDIKSWNTSSGYNNSKSTSQSSTISNVMSKVISEQKGYGESYSSGGSNSESQALASTDTQSDEYSSALTYYTSKIKTTTTTFSSTGNTSGDYRMVMAGTVHVFGVVGYNIADQSYFVYTYNVLDDKTEEYLDYSYDGTFTDYENSVLPFEIPYFVEDYVNSKVARTEGLILDPDTGVIVDYIPTGEKADNIIIIPSYISVDNNDGTFSSVKVTGIEPGLFKNNTDIVAVKFSDYITEIPDSLFEGCTSLEHILCPGVTEIGNNAFSGCTSLESYILPVEITSLGENAFEGVPEIKATASNADIAQTVASCGADNIVLDISAIPDDETKGMKLVVGNNSSFELQGKDKEYKGLSVKSDAAKTVINGVTITENSKIPLELSSNEVVLDRVTVEATGYALVLKAEETAMSLNRTINLRSVNGNAVLCKSVSLAPLTTGIVGKLNVAGNVLVCGEVSNDRYLTVSDGEIIYITADEFENYLSSHKITFDANGGTVTTESKIASLNMPIGELPVPSRDYYSFDGWYLNPQTADGVVDENRGDEITAETLMTALTDITLYAHWIQNDVSAWTLASKVPEDAEVVDRKYSYTQTLYTTSNSASLSGWTQYDVQRTDWGNTQGPVYSNPDDGTRNVWSEQYVTSTTTHYKYYHRYTGSVWGSDSTAPNSSRHSCDLTYSLPAYVYSGGLQFYGNYSTYYACDICGAQRMWLPDGTYTTNNYATRWYYQEPVYTYYYSKTEDKESQSDPSELTDVSNVQEWVQYRVK